MTMKKYALMTLFFLIALSGLATTAHGANLVAHWKFDEVNGDYSSTSSGYTEEVRGTTLTVELPSGGTGVTESSTGLAPGGGSSVTFQSNENRSDPDPDFIEAGSIDVNGVHASGQTEIGSPLDLGKNYTFTAWLKPQIVTDTIGRTIFGTGLWNNNYNVIDQQGSNLRVYSGDRNVILSNVLALDTPIFVAGLVNSSGVPDRPAGTVMTVAAYDPLSDIWYYADGTGGPKNDMQFWNIRMGTKIIGDIDDVRVYDAALTQAELEALVAVIPEPESIALLGLAGFGLLLLTWRRRRTSTKVA